VFRIVSVASYERKKKKEEEMKVAGRRRRRKDDDRPSVFFFEVYGVRVISSYNYIPISISTSISI
jgi:hypothetical protein